MKQIDENETVVWSAAADKNLVVDVVVVEDAVPTVAMLFVVSPKSILVVTGVCVVASVVVAEGVLLELVISSLVVHLQRHFSTEIYLSFNKSISRTCTHLDSFSALFKTDRFHS